MSFTDLESTIFAATNGPFSEQVFYYRSYAVIGRGSESANG
jgi:hypothetical protein